MILTMMVVSSVFWMLKVSAFLSNRGGSQFGGHLWWQTAVEAKN